MSMPKPADYGAYRSFEIKCPRDGSRLVIHGRSETWAIEDAATYGFTVTDERGVETNPPSIWMLCKKHNHEGGSK